MIDLCQETMRYATSISLGKDSDQDRRPYVSVARQYGETAHTSLKPWVVYDVTWDGGVDMGSKTEFDDQREAVAYGWKRLRCVRGGAP